ncbi:MAG TPA: RNA polymerase sigma factor [Cyclobacteriaceae bacterium]|nr:RNA polymerase sigma factor [Cyclobacteriaceae bacterium]HRF35481.1 RNA polymerase sigma factor [Cyclobacteriaceae bacterium]
MPKPAKSIDLMSDEQIMEAVKNGNLQQASILFDRFHKRIFNFLVRMTGDREGAEDLTQNVFLRMLRYRQSYNPEMKFQSWIYQMARNAFADHYQKQKQLKPASMEVEKLHDSLPDLAEAMEQEETEKRLIRALAKLPDDYRELLVLTRFQHLKYEEVAGFLNMTVANVKVKVHRAIGQLRENYFELENA